MRFTLDNDTDHALIGWISKQMGHVCFPTPADIPDDDVAVYADDKSAVLITHDKPFTNRRKQEHLRFGKHVHLAVESAEGFDALVAHFQEVVQLLAGDPPIVLRVTHNGVLTIVDPYTP